MNSSGTFVISLDFELLWGVFDVVNLEKTEQYFINTRKVIPEVLEVFEKQRVNATWATVGMLYNENWEEWKFNQPIKLPHYQNPKLSAYSYGESIKRKNTEVYCFAPEIIQKIHQTPGQEVGTHTYSHYYCLEQGTDQEDFKADIQTAIKISNKANIPVKSLVFPRNQMKAEYLEVCRKAGIINVRSNPASWYWKNTQSNSLSTKIARTGDAYFSFGNKSYPRKELKLHPNELVEQMASRFLRPVEGIGSIRKLKIKRIISEMTNAAKKKEIYHLWWHPHNFGDRPKESMKDLRILMNHYQDLNKKYDFQSMNMAGLGENILSKLK